MEIYDLMSIAAEGYEKRQVNVFFQNDLFKTRVIVLEAGGKIPECQMDSYVMFYVVKGEVLIKKLSGQKGNYAQKGNYKSKKTY